MSGEEWKDLTEYGSDYEVQVDVRSDPPRYRHRELHLGEVQLAEWREGLPVEQRA